jgi:hypothetical protein
LTQGFSVDFARVIAAVSTFLAGRGCPFAVIGGIAIAAYGRVRTTFDVDFVTSTEVQDHLIQFLEAEGFETVHRSAGYSNHVHDDPEMGRVDVVYVGGPTGDELFSDTRIVDGPGNLRVPVLRPEHLAAMKIFAIKNDPSRTHLELDDIRFLLGLEGVNREKIRDQFEKHELGHLYDEIS